jgi:paraquat-inducible protein B
LSSDDPLNNLPQATIEKKSRVRISVIWIIPILAAVIALGIFVQRLRTEGPTITLLFANASGIEAGKTFIKYKDVTIGQIVTVQLSDDYSQVVATAKMSKNAADLIVEDAKFWVVAPHVTLSGVSGLNTLLSGQYLGFEAGKSHKPARKFIVLDVPPVITDQPGSRFRLVAKSLGSVGVGAQVSYHSLPVGQVESYMLAPDGKTIVASIFINAPYDRYVTPQTRFWNASGVDISMGANGFEVRTESLISALVGGLAFDVPEFLTASGPAPGNTEYVLYQTHALAMTQPETSERQFVLHFDESLRGLVVGAPVTLFGLTVGRVSDVGVEYNPATLNLRPRVLITFYPGRLSSDMPGHEADHTIADMSTAERAKVLRHLIEDKGLRAQLQTGSLLTGDLYVDFNYVANAPKSKVVWGTEPQELPVSSGGLATIEAKLTSILTKVDNMPLGQIGGNVNSVLANLTKTLKDADVLLAKVDAQWVPEGTKTLEDLHRAIANADHAYLSKDAPTAQEMHDMLRELTDTARSVRVFIDYLQQHPSTLIRGKKEESP